MTLAPHLIVSALLLGFAYLRLGRRVVLKRWLLPAWTAGVAALSGLLMARAVGGGVENYLVTIPLGLSFGLVLQHLMDYCRTCGAPLRLQSRLQAAGAAARIRPAAGCRCDSRRPRG